LHTFDAEPGGIFLMGSCKNRCTVGQAATSLLRQMSDMSISGYTPEMVLGTALLGSHIQPAWLAYRHQVAEKKTGVTVHLRCHTSRLSLVVIKGDKEEDDGSIENRRCCAGF